MRGTAAGEPVVSQANTKEFAEGHERVFGNKRAQRGKWIWDAEQEKLVPADEYRPPERALDAPIMSGRFYENQAMTDGTPVGSRRRYAQWLKDHDATHASDYSDGFRARLHKERERTQEKEIRETVGRTVYQLENKRR